jgi:hypothetical protein
MTALAFCFLGLWPSADAWVRLVSFHPVRATAAQSGARACGPNIAQAGVPVPHEHREKVAVHVQDRGDFCWR